ncbi:MAG: hypothetical protein NTU91_10085 [Chloroflexi bacterium]|nr:hypothetical protein [Chloroflexota bacterium]
MKLRHRKQEGIPVLKLPPVRLHPVLTALRNHEFDRNGFKDEVLSLFSRELPEKSVFRGMAACRD